MDSACLSFSNVQLAMPAVRQRPSILSRSAISLESEEEMLTRSRVALCKASHREMGPT